MSVWVLFCVYLRTIFGCHWDERAVCGGTMLGAESRLESRLGKLESLMRNPQSALNLETLLVSVRFKAGGVGVGVTHLKSRSGFRMQCDHPTPPHPPHFCKHFLS